MTTLQQELAEAQARVEQLARRIAASSCREVGCDMVHIGGTNAGCGDGCICSIPVHACSKCGDSDYGVNPEAAEHRADCAANGPIGFFE